MADTSSGDEATTFEVESPRPASVSQPSTGPPTADTETCSFNRSSCISLIRHRRYKIASRTLCSENLTYKKGARGKLFTDFTPGKSWTSISMNPALHIQSVRSFCLILRFIISVYCSSCGSFCHTCIHATHSF